MKSFNEYSTCNFINVHASQTKCNIGPRVRIGKNGEAIRSPSGLILMFLKLYINPPSLIILFTYPPSPSFPLPSSQDALLFVIVLGKWKNLQLLIWVSQLSVIQNLLNTTSSFPSVSYYQGFPTSKIIKVSEKA